MAIWSEQVGIKMSLAPLDGVQKRERSRFTKTDSQLPAGTGSHIPTFELGLQSATGVTHLMTGRDLDGNRGRQSPYMNSVCNGRLPPTALLKGRIRRWSPALIAAHELGHNFKRASRRREGPACQSTPPDLFDGAADQLQRSVFRAAASRRSMLASRRPPCLVPLPRLRMYGSKCQNTLVGAVANRDIPPFSFIAHASRGTMHPTL